MVAADIKRGKEVRKREDEWKAKKAQQLRALQQAQAQRQAAASPGVSSQGVSQAKSQPVSQPQKTA